MKTGIVFEGGAFRTVFSCGIMDAFLDNDIMPDYMVGVSAGAAYGISYATRQRGRSYEIISRFANDKRYMGVKHLLNPANKSYYNLKFTYDTIPKELVPLDYEALEQYPGVFEAVVTNAITGRPEYLKVEASDKNFDVLVATCALPLLFPMININGKPYMDGGLADSIPVERAFEQGCDRVVVVLTREPGYTKDTSFVTRLAATYYRKYPMLGKSLLTRADKYNKTLKKLEQYEKEGRIIVIRPEHTKGFSKMEKDLDKINALYQDGLTQGRRIASRVKEFYGMS